MKIVEFRESDIGPRNAKRYMHRAHDFIQIVAVKQDRPTPAEPRRDTATLPPAKVAENQNSKRLIGLGPSGRLTSGLYIQKDIATLNWSGHEVDLTSF